MRILDRHINTSIVRNFLSAVLIFLFLYILIDITSNLDEIISRKVPWHVLIQYYLSFLPVIIVQTSPIASLISVLLTFSSLHNQNEIIAMRASGQNFWQITRPAICLSIVVAAVVFWLNECYVPLSMQESKQIRNENMILEVDRLKKNKENIENLTFYGLQNRLYYVESFNPNTYELSGVTIIERDENQNIVEKAVALKGIWTGIAWKFFKCQITAFDPNNFNAPVKVKVYDEKLMDIKETPEDFLRQRLDVSAMNIRQLKDYIRRFSNSGASKALNNLRVDLHQKIAFPMTNVVVVLVGLPFAMMVKSRKGMTFTSLGIAIIIGFLYYVANAVSLAFGKGDLLPPIVSAWITPFVFSVIALTVIENNF